MHTCGQVDDNSNKFFFTPFQYSTNHIKPIQRKSTVDMFMPTHTAFDVESVAAVSTRIRSTLLDIDSRYPEGGNHIVLTSHADVLQITQCYAAGLENVGMFSQYRFGNGEVRKMGRDVGSLPEPVPLQPPKRGEFAA
mmetsp:Transcript_26828/g.53669  ORF Transcript_26828/g.53669 Transcript_26828/m.53669 type:complete len:137 (+) Transcript_26828:325-735(+)